MSGENWTPAPWRIEGDAVKTAISAGAKHIAMVNYFDCGSGDPRSIRKEEHEANARLIAAAPEMYEALIKCVAADPTIVTNKPGWMDYIASIECARSALKKARGEQ